MAQTVIHIYFCLRHIFTATFTLDVEIILYIREHHCANSAATTHTRSSSQGSHDNNVNDRETSHIKSTVVPSHYYTSATK